MSDVLPPGMEVDWYAWEREVFLRANGQCEYCGKDMMESSDVFYFGRNFDHVRPAEGDGPENRAVACWACNRIKSRGRFDGNSRAEIIANARAHIQAVRERNDQRLAVDKAWFQSQRTGA